MNGVNRDLETWEEVILDFFEQKVQNIKAGQKCKLFGAREYIEKKEKEIETEKDEKKVERAIKGKEQKEKEYVELRKNAPSTEVRQWVDITSKKTIEVGKRIIKATHVLKFTHSSSEPAGLLLQTKSKDPLLTTASVKKDLVADLAHNNGALITVSRFLALSLHGAQIIDLILSDDFCFLRPFTNNVSQLKEWEEGFKGLVEKREINTADKAKQIYFPIDTLGTTVRNKYHIVVPLFSSSLTHEIDSIVTALKYGDKQKTLNKARKAEAPKFLPGISVEFPSSGVLQFGGEHPKNISMLNADRSGKSFLFSSQPPIWQTQFKPPIDKRKLFSHFFSRRSDEVIVYLRNFLLCFERADLSIKNPKRKKWIESWVNQIIDEVMICAISIQNLPPGWSRAEKNRLKAEHQCFLDPYRDDETFQTLRETNSWQNVICVDFADWLNGKLKGREKQFTPQPEYTKMWKKLMEKELREHAQAIDWDIKEQNREKQI